MKEVFIVGEMNVAPEHISQVERILSTLREKTRLETGCIFYQFFQAETTPGVFATIEHWKNTDAEEAHWKTEHIKEASYVLEPLLLSPMHLSRYNRISDEVGCE